MTEIEKRQNEIMNSNNNNEIEILIKKEKELVDIIKNNILSISEANYILEIIYKIHKKIGELCQIKAPNLDKSNFPIDFQVCHNLMASAERNTPQGFIIESEPLFDYEFDNLIRNENAPEAILDTIVSDTRLKLDELYQKDVPHFKDKSLTNACSSASFCVDNYAEELKVKSQRFRINQGFLPDNTQTSFTTKGLYHYFNIVEINKKQYIVDCSYRQYFENCQNNLQRLGMIYTIAPRVGAFMLMTEERKKLAQTILKRGWIECTPENLKTYLDGFALFYRNGLYYEETGDFSYTTSYTPEDYVKFLNHEDNQVLHESPKTLGLQRESLQNINLHF